jgi:phosphate starvation-inducible PhoH-like protein
MSSKQRRTRRQQQQAEVEMEARAVSPVPSQQPLGKRLEAKTQAQKEYISSIKHHRITWGIGPAGVGKTYVAARTAAAALKAGEITQIILSRPAVEASNSIGFLKGDMDEKMAPYIASYGRGFADELGSAQTEYYMKNRVIETVPLNFMQGRSFDEPTLVLLDEAENATPQEMKMFLTRMGTGARLVIDGDPEQTMIKGHSGLIDGYKRTRYIRGVGAVIFTRDDIVREPLIKEILAAYEDRDSEEEDGFDLPSFISGDVC